MRFTILRCCQFGLSALVVVAFSQFVWSADEPKIKQLQKERLAVLQKVVELKDRSFRSGEIPLSERANAYQQAFDAELELCDNDAEKIKVREKMLEQAKVDEETVARLKRAGEAGAWDLPTATARRLAIEIELERLKKQ